MGREGGGKRTSQRPGEAKGQQGPGAGQKKDKHTLQKRTKFCTKNKQETQHYNAPRNPAFFHSAPLPSPFPSPSPPLPPPSPLSPPTLKNKSRSKQVVGTVMLDELAKALQRRQGTCTIITFWNNSWASGMIRKGNETQRDDKLQAHKLTISNTTAHRDKPRELTTEMTTCRDNPWNQKTTNT